MSLPGVRRWIFQSWICLVAWCAAGIALAADLTTVAEVRALTDEEVAKHPDALITARVTFIACWKGHTEASVQDESGGIYTYFKNNEGVSLNLGDEITIRGTGRGGIWAPTLETDIVTPTGGRGLPIPRRVDYPELKSGAADSQFVEVEGIVRDVKYEPTVSPPSTIITLAMHGGRAEVFMTLIPETNLLDLVDSKVLIKGVPFHYFNQRRQAFEFRVMTCDSSEIEVIDPVHAKPFEMPVTRAGKLLQYQNEGSPGHRVRVQGMVTLHWPGEFLFLQDGEDGLLVRSRRKDELKPGDFVDVAGFASMGGYAAFLEDAEFRKIGSQASPAGIPIPLDELAMGKADALLVETHGVLESISEHNGRANLMIRRNRLIVTAELPISLNEMPEIIPGSVISLTGICQVDVGSQRKFARYYRPESARLLLRSAADVKVIQAASWWTAQRLVFALTVLLIVLGVSLVWAWILQSGNLRLKREITGRQRAEAEVKRREEERKLLAADLHDSLEQSLTGVALQLQAAGNSSAKETRSPHLALAERLLKYSREEVHRAVRDLREPTDEAFDLTAALRGLVRRSSMLSPASFELDVTEEMSDLPGHLSHQLLHLVQEGVTNSLKHARPSVIRISIRRSAGTVVLKIEDEGDGFDQSNCAGPAEGHFGLQGMKERIARLGGTLEIDSEPGAGTRIVAALPLSS